MNRPKRFFACPRRSPIDGRLAFTIIEMLVVIALIGVLAAMLFPALHAVRESSRRAICQSNLRQISQGLTDYATAKRVYCSGAFDWRQDGAVTEVGWVADLVNNQINVGNMLCPSNPRQLADTYNDLLNTAIDSSGSMTVGSGQDMCRGSARLGTTSQAQSDGTSAVNPCRTIAGDSSKYAPGSSDRVNLVRQQILQKGYNTNYTASWFLVRGGLLLDASGNLLSSDAANCPAALTSRTSTLGPLAQSRVDNAVAPAAQIPLMGCGGKSVELSQMDFAPGGALNITTPSMTGGPVLKSDAGTGMVGSGTAMSAPKFPDGTPREGTRGWWTVWNGQTLQDYRQFGPVHKGICNVLFADGSVRTLSDNNNDGYLNDGFSTTSSNGFKDNYDPANPNVQPEVPADQLYGGWVLKPKDF